MSFSPPRISSSVSDKISKRQACAYIERLIKPLLEEQNASALLALDSLLVAIFAESATRVLDPSAFTEVSSSIVGFVLSNLLHSPVNYYLLSDRWVRGQHKLSDTWARCSYTLTCCKKRPSEEKNNQIALQLKKQTIKREIFSCLVHADRLVRQLKKPSLAKVPHTALNESLDQITRLTTELATIPTREVKFSDFFFKSPFIDDRKMAALSTTLGILLFNHLFDPKLDAFAAGSSVLFGTVFTWLINLLYHGLNTLIHCDSHTAGHDINIKLAADERDFCRDAGALPSEMRQALLTTQVWHRCESTPQMADEDEEEAKRGTKTDEIALSC